MSVLRPMVDLCKRRGLDRLYDMNYGRIQSYEQAEWDEIIREFSFEHALFSLVRPREPTTHKWVHERLTDRWFTRLNEYDPDTVDCDCDEETESCYYCTEYIEEHHDRPDIDEFMKQSFDDLPTVVPIWHPFEAYEELSPAPVPVVVVPLVRPVEEVVEEIDVDEEKVNPKKRRRSDAEKAYTDLCTEKYGPDGVIIDGVRCITQKEIDDAKRLHKNKLARELRKRRREEKETASTVAPPSRSVSEVVVVPPPVSEERAARLRELDAFSAELRALDNSLLALRERLDRMI